MDKLSGEDIESPAYRAGLLAGATGLAVSEPLNYGGVDSECFAAFVSVIDGNHGVRSDSDES